MTTVPFWRTRTISQNDTTAPSLSVPLCSRKRESTISGTFIVANDGGGHARGDKLIRAVDRIDGERCQGDARCGGALLIIERR